jgi:lipocalin
MLAAAVLLVFAAVMVLALVLEPCHSSELMSLCWQQARAPTATLIALKREQGVWLESARTDV